MTNNQEKLLETYVEELQELETVAFQLLDERYLETAVGSQLDGLGQIIGRERQGADDETYRLLLRSQIQLNLSSGTVEQILTIVSLTIPGITLELTQEFIAAFELTAIEALPHGTGVIVAALIQEARAGGVKGLLHYHEDEPEFAFDGFGSAKFDGGYYFGTSIDTTTMAAAANLFGAVDGAGLLSGDLTVV